MTDRQPDQYTGVICTQDPMGNEGCGKQGLTKAEYMAQMMRVDSTWRCPVCGMEAYWDDERYEAGLDKLSKAYHPIIQEPFE